MMQEGKVRPTLHKNPITSEQQQQLYENRATWRVGYLGLDPSQLLTTAWFYITFYCGKRERENQRKRTSDMFFFLHTSQGRRYYAFRSPFSSKVVWQITLTNPTVKFLLFLIQALLGENPSKLPKTPESQPAGFVSMTKRSVNKKMKWGTAIPPSAKAHSKTYLNLSGYLLLLYS